MSTSERRLWSLSSSSFLLHILEEEVSHAGLPLWNEAGQQTSPSLGLLPSPTCLEYGLGEPSVFKILLDPYESRVTHHLPPGLLDFPASSDQLPGFGPSPGD